jgi:hypothetical protein
LTYDRDQGQGRDQVNSRNQERGTSKKAPRQKRKDPLIPIDLDSEREMERLQKLADEWEIAKAQGDQAKTIAGHESEDYEKYWNLEDGYDIRDAWENPTEEEPN